MLEDFESSIEFMTIPHISTVDIREQANYAKKWKMSFKAFYEGFLEDIRYTENKTDVPLFIPSTFKPESEWTYKKDESKGPGEQVSYRLTDNQEKITLVTLDFDDSIQINGKSALENAQEAFCDCEYVIYTTHSRTKDNPEKYRMVLRPEHPIPVDNWPEYITKIIEALGADKACANPGRIFFLPSCIPNNEKNKDVYLKPFSIHNPGGPVTVDLVDKIYKNFEQHLKKTGQQERLDKINAKINKKPKVEGKRHPAGGIVTNNVTSSKVDTSYEGYLKRHMPTIEDSLASGLRHEFALRSIMREFSRNKDMVDIDSLVMFLYKAVEDFNDTYLYMEGSPKEDRHVYKTAEQISRLKFQRSLRNTPRELEELITSAINSTSNMTRSPEYFTNRLDAAIRAAEHASYTNKWIFKKSNRVVKDKKDVKKDPLSPYEEEFKEIINEFRETRSLDNLFDDIFKEISGRTDAYYKMQLAMKTINECHQQLYDRPIKTKPFDREMIRQIGRVVSKGGSTLNGSEDLDRKKYEKDIINAYGIYKANMNLDTSVGQSLNP